MSSNHGLPAPAILESMSHGVLVFDQSNQLVMENQAAAAILGGDLKIIRAEGWKAAAALFSPRGNNPDQTLDAVRERALSYRKPERFLASRAGDFLTCYASPIDFGSGQIYTMITLEMPDWSAVTELFDKYLAEVRDNVETTRGHADLILNSLKRPKPNESVEQLGRRISGFARLIQTHMHRLGRLTQMMERMERIRTNNLKEQLLSERRQIILSDFMEDFIEGLSEERLLDPETEAHDYRSRLHFDVPDDLAIYAAPGQLSAVLRDMLRNAIMYSMVATPITISARADEWFAQINMSDEGYGIRAGESERIFASFQRARQPQIMGEFGYGLSLYLCKHEVEAMNGRLWFESDEGVGTTFSIKLPLWADDSVSSHSEDASS